MRWRSPPERWAPEPNVFADRHIKEEIILRNVGDAAVVFFKRKIPDVHATDFDIAAVNIPQRGDKASNRRFARTARAHECGKAPFGENHVDAVENFLLFFAFDSLMIAESHIFQRDGIVGGFALVGRGARKFLHFEHRADFAENDARLADIVAITHDGKERHHDTHRNDDDGDKIHCRNGKGMRPNAATHPFDKTVAPFFCGYYKLVVRRL